MMVNGKIQAPTALLPEKNPLYPFNMRMGGPQSRVGRFTEQKKKTLSIPGFESRTVQPVA